MVLSVLILSVFIGSVLGAFFSTKKNWHGLLLSFSGAFLLSITLLEIFPHIYSHQHSEEVGLFVLLGVLTQLILEMVTRGAEHGHFHFYKSKRFPIGIFAGLLLHAFIEGVPLQENMDMNLVIGVAIHKIPVAMILYIFLKETTQKVWKIAIFMFIFALASPLGNVVGTFLNSHDLELALALTAGVFLHISTVIIFESSDHHHLKIKKLTALLVGFFLAYFSVCTH